MSDDELLFGRRESDDAHIDDAHRAFDELVKPAGFVLAVAFAGFCLITPFLVF